MLEILIIAALIAAGIAVLAGRRVFKKPRFEPGAEAEEKPFKIDPRRAALPINRCQLAKVRHVIDGDSIVATTSTQEILIRLGAIDCPQNGQHWGDVATLGLIKLIGGRQVAFEGHGVDKHGRTIATVYVRDVDNAGWTDVNARMVARGHAWVTRRDYRFLPSSRKSELNRLERWAQRKRVGLWKSRDGLPDRRQRAGIQ